MQDVQKGYKESVTAGVVGFIIQILIIAFGNTSLIPSWYILMLYLIQFVGVLSDIAMLVSFVRRNIGIGFGIGWWFGMGIMAYTGLMELWLFILYIAITIAVIALKVWNDSRDSGY